MADLEFIPVTTPEEQRTLADMAAHVWNEYWPPIIGQEQVDYMVEKFQSLGVIQHDMRENGYEYWFIAVREDDGTSTGTGERRIIGYTGGHDEADAGRYFISKIYLLAEGRGRGLSARIIAFYENLCRARGLSTMYLTVNKKNELAKRAYIKNGFEVTDAVETDIGNGFVMDDYIMERSA